MPLTIPSLDDLRQQVKATIAARVPGADMALRRAVLPIIGEVIARAVHPVWRALAGWFSQQLFKASMASEYLDREAGHYGITRLSAATAAGSVTLTGTDGVSVPAGAGLQTSNGSAVYAVQAAVTIASGTATATVRAVTGGELGNLDAGTLLTLITAVAGVQPTATVAAGGLSGGSDAETDASLRARLLTRLSDPPQGGAPRDYLAWAKLTPGVTRAWVRATRGPGTVDIFVTFDGRDSNVPLSGDLVTIQAVIDDLRPVTVDALVLAPIADALAVEISDLYPDSAAIRASITVSIQAAARQVGPGSMEIGDGVTSADPGGIFYRSQIAGAVQAVGGIDHFVLVAPASDTTFALGHIPATPSVTFS